VGAERNFGNIIQLGEKAILPEGILIDIVGEIENKVNPIPQIGLKVL